MAMTAILTALILSVAPTFGMVNGYSPASADAIMTATVNGEYHAYMDFNGDGVLSVMDAVGVLKKYVDNSTNGNTLTYGEKDVMAVVEENLNPSEYSDYFYYEIDFVNNKPCRMYSYEYSEYTVLHVYCEVNDTTFQYTVGIDPITETAVVLD